MKTETGGSREGCANCQFELVTSPNKGVAVSSCILRDLKMLQMIYTEKQLAATGRLRNFGGKPCKEEDLRAKMFGV